MIWVPIWPRCWWKWLILTRFRWRGKIRIFFFCDSVIVKYCNNNIFTNQWVYSLEEAHLILPKVSSFKRGHFTKHMTNSSNIINCYIMSRGNISWRRKRILKFLKRTRRITFLKIIWKGHVLFSCLMLFFFIFFTWEFIFCNCDLQICQASPKNKALLFILKRV